MKSLVLGIMILSVSASFAQEENATHQLKNRFKAKQTMTVDRPSEMAIKQKDNSKPKQTNVLSRNEVKSDFTSGIIRVKNGVAFIDVQNGNFQRRLKPTNLPKAAMVDGQEIQFRYTVEDESSSNQGAMAVQLHDVSQMTSK